MLAPVRTFLDKNATGGIDSYEDYTSATTYATS